MPAQGRNRQNVSWHLLHLQKTTLCSPQQSWPLTGSQGQQPYCNGPKHSFNRALGFKVHACPSMHLLQPLGTLKLGAIVTSHIFATKHMPHKKSHARLPFFFRRGADRRDPGPSQDQQGGSHHSSQVTGLIGGYQWGGRNSCEGSFSWEVLKTRSSGALSLFCAIVRSMISPSHLADEPHLLIFLFMMPLGCLTTPDMLAPFYALAAFTSIMWLPPIEVHQEAKVYLYPLPNVLMQEQSKFGPKSTKSVVQESEKIC